MKHIIAVLGILFLAFLVIAPEFIEAISINSWCVSIYYVLTFAAIFEFGKVIAKWYKS